MTWGASPSANSGVQHFSAVQGSQTITISLVAGDHGFVAGGVFALGSGTDPNGANFSIYDNVGGSGTPWTVVWGQNTSALGTAGRPFIAYRPNLPSGITSITLVPNDNLNYYWSVAAWSQAGGATSASLDVSNDGGTGGTPPWTISSLTNTDSNAMFVAVVINDDGTGGTTWSTPTGYTDVINNASADNVIPVEVCFRIVTSTGAQAPQFNPQGQASPGAVSGVFAAFKPAAGASFTPDEDMQLTLTSFFVPPLVSVWG